MNMEFYRAVDASINRGIEGIRVCEDILRFIIQTDKSFEFKELRHELRLVSDFFPGNLTLKYRDVDSDKQKFFDIDSEKNRDSIHDVFSANIHRSIEAVRSLEEFSKIVDSSISHKFQEIRFKLYQYEKESYRFFINNLFKEKIDKSLYAILDSAFIKDNNYFDVANLFIKGGADIIQLRIKNLSEKEILKIARDISALCKKNDVIFIINDDPAIAFLSDSTGLHLGQDDISINDARKILKQDQIVGVSTHSYEQALKAIKDGADYIAIGPIYDTKNKYGELIKGFGINLIEKVKSITPVPIVAIGGINLSNSKEVINSGASSLAMIGYLYSNDKIIENCKFIVENISC